MGIIKHHIIFHFIMIITFPFLNISLAQVSSIRNQICTGTRPVGMGETFIAVADDGNTIFWNPAGIPHIDRYELQTMHGNLYNTGIKNNYISFLIPNLPYLPYSGKLAFGLDWSNLHFGDEELEFSQNTFAFSTGYRFLNWLSLGFKMKFFNNMVSLDGLTESKASGWGYDFGTLLSPIPRLSLGFTIYDVANTKFRYKGGGSEVIYYQNIRYGAAYKFNKLFFLTQPLLALDVDDRLHFGTEFWLWNILGLRMGIQKDLYAHGEEKVTLSYGASVQYHFIRFDYALTNSPFLDNTNRFSINLNFSLAKSPVVINQIRVRDFYASQYIHHTRDTCAVISVENRGEKPVTCNLKFKQKEGGIFSESVFSIDRELSPIDSIVLLTNLHNNILKLPATEVPLHATVILEPRTLISTKREIKTSPEFSVYGLRVINWALGVEQAAAFVCPGDKTVQKFITEILALYKRDWHNFVINENISTAALIFDALGKYGLRYQIDSNSPYAQVHKGLDVIQYPFDLLKTKLGDCDDTSVLYTSLLECCGIRTAFVDDPKHIYILFDTGIHENDRLKLCVGEELYVIKDHHVWLPVETTQYGKPFLRAWLLGAEIFNQSMHEGFGRITDIHNAWEKRYRPISIQYQEESIHIPDRKEIDEFYQLDKILYGSMQNKFLQENYYKVLENNPNDLKRRNELAFILHSIGREKEAMDLLKYLKE